MEKRIDTDQKTVDYIFGSVGLIYPRTELELDNFNKLYSEVEFDLDGYLLNPDRAFAETITTEITNGRNKFKFECSENTYFKRAVLAAEITTQLYFEPTFGNVKLQKLMFLCENIEEVNINFEYSKQAAGPYDNKFMHSIGAEFKRQGWFKVEREKNGDYFRNKYVPLEKFGNHKEYFSHYFSCNQERILWFIDTFRKEKTDQVELVATLYACWKELLSQNRLISDDNLISLLYDWSKEKKKYSRRNIIYAIEWMKDNKVIPYSAK